MNTTICRSARSVTLEDDEPSRNAELSVGVQACEAIDEIFVTRTMFGRQVTSATLEVALWTPPAKLNVQKKPATFRKRYFLLGLCLACFICSFSLLMFACGRITNVSGGLLLGSAFGFVCYELWLITGRILRSSRN